MAVSRAVAHHAFDHRRSLLGVKGDLVCLQLLGLGVEGLIGLTRFEGKEHGEQLRRMADPCGYTKWRLLVQREIAHPPHPECLRGLVGYQILQSTKNFTECGMLQR